MVSTERVAALCQLVAADTVREFCFGHALLSLMAGLVAMRMNCVWWCARLRVPRRLLECGFYNASLASASATGTGTDQATSAYTPATLNLQACEEATPWVDVGHRRNATRRGLELREGARYVTVVRAYNGKMR